jgi:hypothetical protein
MISKQPERLTTVSKRIERLPQGVSDEPRLMLTTTQPKRTLHRNQQQRSRTSPLALSAASTLTVLNLISAFTTCSLLFCAPTYSAVQPS